MVHSSPWVGLAFYQGVHHEGVVGAASLSQGVAWEMEGHLGEAYFLVEASFPAVEGVAFLAEGWLVLVVPAMTPPCMQQLKRQDNKQLIKCKILLSIYCQLCVVQYGEMGG